MGTWGTGAFDNDSAADMVAKFCIPIEKAFNAKTNRSARWYYEEARCATRIILMAHGTDVLGGPSLSKSLSVLNRMLCDKEWIDNFRDPRPIIAAIKADIRAVVRKMNACRGCSPRLFREKSTKSAAKSRKATVARMKRNAKKSDKPLPPVKR